MSDSSGTIIIVFIVILIVAVGGVAAWYFLVYKPGLGPAPAPAYVAAPIAYTTIPPPSSPPPSDDDDYDPLSLGEVVSDGKFSIALWRIQMKKKYSKKLDVLKKRLKVLEDAKEAEKEMSGTVPSEHFDDAITYLKNLIKKAPKAAPAPKASAGDKKAFDMAKWKVATKNAYKNKSPEYIQKGIDRLKKGMNEKRASTDGVPRSKYPEAIAWFKILKRGASKNKNEKKFDFAKWKADSKKKLAKKSKSVIQRAIDKAKTEVPRENRPAAVRFLKGLKAKAKK
jgi:hypothetical protein